MNMTATVSVPVWAPDPMQGGAIVATQATIEWWQSEPGVVRMQAAGIWNEPARLEGSTVFHALWGVRAKLPEVTFLVQGARRDAWASTPNHSCGIDEVRLYPDLGQPPHPVAVSALAEMPREHWDRLSSCDLHMLYRQSWEGAPSGLSWTAWKTSRPQPSAQQRYS